MNTKKILESINNQGGFDNFNNWDKAEEVQWIKTNYTCSKKVAKNGHHQKGDD